MMFENLRNAAAIAAKCKCNLSTGYDLFFEFKANFDRFGLSRDHLPNYVSTKIFPGNRQLITDIETLASWEKKAKHGEIAVLDGFANLAVLRQFRNIQIFQINNFRITTGSILRKVEKE